MVPFEQATPAGQARSPLHQGVAFVVDDLEGELARVRGEGVVITMPLTEEEWGERAFGVRDPNGVIVQLVDRQGRGAF